MVTGGWNTAGERTTSVELLNLDGSRNCSLPPLPEARGWFTQTGLVACGGTTTNNTCVSFSLRDGGDSAVNIRVPQFLYRYHGLHFVWASSKKNVMEAAYVTMTEGRVVTDQCRRLGADPHPGTGASLPQQLGLATGRHVDRWRGQI